MNAIHYIGFDVHKKTISFCVKTADGQIVEEGRLEADRTVLRRWAAGRKRAWHGAMEATLFSAWIYDTLKPYAQQLSMGHPAKMKAITAGKNKSDRIDARTIADLLRCNLLPASYVLPPSLRGTDSFSGADGVTPNASYEGYSVRPVIFPSIETSATGKLGVASRTASGGLLFCNDAS